MVRPAARYGKPVAEYEGRRALTEAASNAAAVEGCFFALVFVAGDDAVVVHVGLEDGTERGGAEQRGESIDVALRIDHSGPIAATIT